MVRASVSKTEGPRFESERPCQPLDEERAPPLTGPMLPIAREMVAYAIMAGAVLAALPFLIAALRRRRREKLRRRGVKRYGH